MIPKEFSNHVSCLGAVQHKSCLKNKGYNSIQCRTPFVLFCEVPAEVLALEVVQSESIHTSIHRASGMNGCSLCATSIRAASIILQSPQNKYNSIDFLYASKKVTKDKAVQNEREQHPPGRAPGAAGVGRSLSLQRILIQRVSRAWGL